MQRRLLGGKSLHPHPRLCSWGPISPLSRETVTEITWRSSITSLGLLVPRGPDFSSTFSPRSLKLSVLHISEWLRHRRRPGHRLSSCTTRHVGVQTFPLRSSQVKAVTSLPSRRSVTLHRGPRAQSRTGPGVKPGGHPGGHLLSGKGGRCGGGRMRSGRGLTQQQVGHGKCISNS